MSYYNKYSAVTEKYRDILPLIIVAVINVVYFAAVISASLGLQTDDFVLFGVIKSNPYPVCLNPDEHFFFFVRPLSYFTFWLDSVFWLSSPVCIRIFSLVFHLIFISGFYLLLIKLSNFFQIKFNRLMATAILLLLTFHLDTLIWINWISNRTELLYIMFYTYSIIFALDYLVSSKKSNNKLVAYTCCYVLSVFSKAQPLHLPLLILFLLYIFMDKIDPARRSVLFRLSLWLVLIIPASIALNWHIYGSNYDLNNILWRKPFAMAGIWLYVISPFWASDVYGYFLQNKMSAVVISVLLMTAAALYLVKHKEKIKLFLGIAVFNIIIFFPRLSAEGSNRINSIQIFWLLIVVYVVLSKMNRKKLISACIVILLFIGMHVYDNYNYIKGNIKYNQKLTGYIEQLNRDFDYEKEKIVILASYYEGISVPYQAFYEKHKMPGRAEMVNSPVLFSFPFINRRSNIHIKCEIINGELAIKALDELTTLVYVYIDKNAKAFPLIEKRESRTRGLSYLRCRIPEKYLSDDYTKIYFNGEKWVKL